MRTKNTNKKSNKSRAQSKYTKSSEKKLTDSQQTSSQQMTGLGKGKHIASLETKTSSAPTVIGKPNIARKRVQ